MRCGDFWWSKSENLPPKMLSKQCSLRSLMIKGIGTDFEIAKILSKEMKTTKNFHLQCKQDISSVISWSSYSKWSNRRCSRICKICESRFECKSEHCMEFDYDCKWKRYNLDYRISSKINDPKDHLARDKVVRKLTNHLI